MLARKPTNTGFNCSHRSKKSLRINMKITLSKHQWKMIGENTGWIKSADIEPITWNDGLGHKPRKDIGIDDFGRKRKIYHPGESCPRCDKPMQKHPLRKTHEQYKDIKQCPYCFMDYS